jgi:aryl-alcohol dehydrogenase-like predicted oxidoreductase
MGIGGIAGCAGRRAGFSGGHFDWQLVKIALAGTTAFSDVEAIRMKISRREFIGKSALGVGGLMLGTALPSLAASEAANFDPYEIIPLGRTGLKVSRVCMGTGSNGFFRSSNQTRMGSKSFETLLRGAYDRGIRMFDLADLYGSHPYLMPALKGIPRNDFVVVTKIWRGPSGLPEPERPDVDGVVTRFLKEINTDYLDLVLLHCVTVGSWPDQQRRQMDILSKFKNKGVIRALGVSCHSIPALEAAANDPWVESVHARINPYGASMDGRPTEVVPILKTIHAAGKGVVGMKIIGAGEFSNSDEMRNRSVRFVLRSGCVDVLNVGFESHDQIDDLAARVRNVPRAIV